MKMIGELSEQILQLEESTTTEIMANRKVIEEHQEVIDEFQRVTIKTTEPLPFALVGKLGEINNQIEGNHEKLILEELLKMQSRFASEVARLESDLNKSNEIKDLWTALE